MGRGDNIGTNQDFDDGDQWNRYFATCAIEETMENDLGCDDQINADSIGCHLEESGCLFDLQTDPCEYTNLATVNPDILDAMIQRLDYYAQKATSPLITEDNTLDFEIIDPHNACDSEFWCPFQLYQDVEFENVLGDEYKTLYPEVIPSMFHHTKEQNIQSVILLVVLCSFLFMSICAIFYVNGKYSANLHGFYSKFIHTLHRHTPTNTNHLLTETAPLVH